MSFESKNVGGGSQPESSSRRPVDDQLLRMEIPFSPEMLSPAVQPADLQPSMEELLIPGSVNEYDLPPRIYTLEYSRRRFQLRFSTGVSSPVMTGKNIRGEGCQFIKVVLFDDSGNEIVSGPEALGEVEIVVLREIFPSAAGAENWMAEEFDENIVTGWIKDHKKSPLAGATILKLNGGVGVLNDIRFTHDRRWVSKTKCRLGARAVDKNNRLRVREAITEPFELKDCRLEWNGKHCSPSLLDEVWRLKKIARDGPRDIRLREANIKTVKDFLILLFSNPPKLQQIYGGAGKNWEDTVRHARTCADKMDFALKSVISAFEHPENVGTAIDDEKDLVHGSPHDLPCASYNHSCEPQAANPSAANEFGVKDMIFDHHADDHIMQPTHDHLFPDQGLMMHIINDEFFDSESYLLNYDHWFREESSYNNDHDLGSDHAGNQRQINDTYEYDNDEKPAILDIVGASSVLFAAGRVQRRGKELWRVWSNVWFFIKKMGHDQAGHVHANKRLRHC